jgi:hypothetical protein
MSEMQALAEELREYTAMKYAGDCKCGKCQLVPRALVERIYHTLNGSSVRCSAVSEQPVAYRFNTHGDQRWRVVIDRPVPKAGVTAFDKIESLYLQPTRAEPQTAPPVRADLPPQHEIRELIDSFEKPDNDTRRAFASHRRTWIVQCLRAVLVKRSQADSSPQAAPELTATCQKLLPGGVVDDATYAEIEDALDRADAPATVGGRWLKLHERIAALTAERPAASAEPQSQAESAK